MVATNAIAKIAAVAAGLALVASTFAFAPAAKAATFMMDLTIGSTGADVTSLQTWLISKGYSIPAGATGYFGAQTQAALAAFQAANGISPAVGYFGPITRAKVNGMGGTTGGSTSGGALSGDEASLEDFNAKSGDDDNVDENGTAEVAVFDFDVRDGDVRVERVDLSFTPATGNDEQNPWDTFDTVTLKADGDEIASEDVSDEDDWLENDSEPYVFRFSGIDLTAMEDDNVEITVEVEAQNGIDGINDGETWTVEIEDENLRAIDGAGIDQYTGDSTGEEVTFDVQAEGGDDQLDVRSSTDDPDATTLKVETNSTSEWYNIFTFDLEADEDGNDIELDQLGISFVTSDDNVSDVVNDLKLMIDGEEFDDFDWVSPAGTSASSTFDIDKDYTVSSGERVPVEVMAKFKSTAAYTAGATIAASTTGSMITGEGADDVVADGSSSGETHTLQTSGINVTPSDDSAAATSVDGTDNDYGTFTVEVEVEAFDEDQFIDDTSASFTYRFENAGTGATIATSTATSSSQSISSSATLDSGFYRVNAGETETFTYTFTIDPGQAYEGIQYRAQLLTILFNNVAAAADSTWTANPENDYETNAALIAD